MEDVYKKSLMLISYIARLNGVCNNYRYDPNDIDGEEIVDLIEKCEEGLTNMKLEIHKMVKEIEDRGVKTRKTSHIKGVVTKNGTLLI